MNTASKKIAAHPPQMQHNNSRLRQAAKRAGIKIEPTQPHLPVTEQEQADTM